MRSGAILRPPLLTPPFSPQPTTILLPLSINLLRHPGLTLVLSQPGFSVVGMVLTALCLIFSLSFAEAHPAGCLLNFHFPLWSHQRTQFCLRGQRTHLKTAFSTLLGPQGWPRDTVVLRELNMEVAGQAPGKAL